MWDTLHFLQAKEATEKAMTARMVKGRTNQAKSIHIQNMLSMIRMKNDRIPRENTGSDNNDDTTLGEHVEEMTSHKICKEARWRKTKRERRQFYIFLTKEE